MLRAVPKLDGTGAVIACVHRLPADADALPAAALPVVPGDTAAVTMGHLFSRMIAVPHGMAEELFCWSQGYTLVTTEPRLNPAA